jgi:glycerol-1-phosphate dehydrogenase [NAD(P)+]
MTTRTPETSGASWAPDLDSPVHLDTDDLPGFYATLSTISGRDRTLVLSDVVTGPDAISQLFTRETFGGDICGILLVVDDTEILRDGENVLDLVHSQLRAVAPQSLTARTEVLTDNHGLHTTPRAIAQVRAALQERDVVVAIGSGTITDITKHAVFEFEQQTSDAEIELVVVQTANSVCAFTSGLAVITTDGVKRTVPSRLPNRLILDTTVLAQAPTEYTNGGIGDSAVAASSIADYRLAHLLGQGSFEPLAGQVVADTRTAFLSQDPVLADRGVVGAERLGLDLVACGLAMTLAGESAPLSGLEHVTSHMLDMAADYFGRTAGNHGSQCGLATALTLIAFEILLEEVDLPGTHFATPQIDQVTELASVQAAFGHLDSDGAHWRECWNDYSIKLAAWADHREALVRFGQEWERHRVELRGLITSPEKYMAALSASGHPLAWQDVPPGISEDQARWAFANARLMRKRVSVADLLYFAGVWDSVLVDRIFSRYHQICSDLSK